MLSNQRGQALVIVLLLTAFIFLIGGAALAMGSTARKTAVLESDQKRAYYIAEAGIEKALARAKQSSQWLGGLTLGVDYNLVPDIVSPVYSGGSIGYVKLKKINSDENKILLSIESRGAYRQSSRVIKVVAELGRPLGFHRGVWTQSLPSWSGVEIDSDIIVNGNIDFRNNCLINGDVWAAGNVTMEQNTEITPRHLFAGGSVTVEGNGLVTGDIQAVGDVFLVNNDFVGGEISSMGNVLVSNSSAVIGNIRANGEVILDSNVDVQGEILPGQSMNLRFALPEFPSIDLEWYRKNTDYYTGNQVWSGHLNLDGIHFVDGDLDIRGTYSGVATIVVRGKVYFSGDLNAVDPEHDVLCLIGGGDVLTQNLARIDALLYTPGEARLAGGTELHGSVIARSLHLGDGAKISYEPALAVNQPDWVTSAVRIVSWEEK